MMKKLRRLKREKNELIAAWEDGFRTALSQGIVHMKNIKERAKDLKNTMSVDLNLINKYKNHTIKISENIKVNTEAFIIILELNYDFLKDIKIK